MLRILGHSTAMIGGVRITVVQFERTTFGLCAIIIGHRFQGFRLATLLGPNGLRVPDAGRVVKTVQLKRGSRQNHV